MGRNETTKRSFVGLIYNEVSVTKQLTAASRDQTYFEDKGNREYMVIDFDPELLGKRVELLRKEAGYRRQSDLAEEIGVHRAYISQIEVGKADNPTLKVIWDLARVLKTTPAYLLGFDESPGVVIDDMEDLPANIREILYEIVDFDESALLMLRNLIRALKVTAQEEKARTANMLDAQRQMLQDIYDAGGEESLMKFFDLVGFTPPGDMRSVEIRFGLSKVPE